MTLIWWAKTCILQRKREVPLIVRKEGGPDVDVYIPSQKVMKSYLKAANIFFENETEFTYFGLHQRIKILCMQKLRED
jgi:hypothetical protein